MAKSGPHRAWGYLELVALVAARHKRRREPVPLASSGTVEAGATPAPSLLAARRDVTALASFR